MLYRLVSLNLLQRSDQELKQRVIQGVIARIKQKVEVFSAFTVNRSILKVETNIHVLLNIQIHDKNNR
jgi:hypothetical protein